MYLREKDDRMTRPQAFIFDLNGTMIDDMRYHSAAWFSILNDDLKAGLTREEVDRQMYGKNEELLDRVFGKGRFTPRELAEISQKKERSYQAAFRPYLQLLPGLPALLEKAKKHRVRMAIGSAAIPFNIDFVLDNLDIRHYFDAIVSADDVTVSKPDPETFTKAAHILGVDPEACIVFEDAPKGIEAAFRAGMNSIVLTTMHEKEEFGRYSNVICFIKDYTDPSLDELFI
jgi:beta-phosphoglucomutase